MGLSDIDKFSYLKSLLVGVAASTIEGLPLTIDNYVVAIDLLRQRFGKKENIIQAHMHKLLSLKSTKAVSSFCELRMLYDDIEIHV